MLSTSLAHRLPVRHRRPPPIIALHQFVMNAAHVGERACDDEAGAIGSNLAHGAQKRSRGAGIERERLTARVLVRLAVVSGLSARPAGIVRISPASQRPSGANRPRPSAHPGGQVHRAPRTRGRESGKTGTRARGAVSQTDMPTPGGNEWPARRLSGEPTNADALVPGHHSGGPPTQRDHGNEERVIVLLASAFSRVRALSFRCGFIKRRMHHEVMAEVRMGAVCGER